MICSGLRTSAEGASSDFPAFEPFFPAFFDDFFPFFVVVDTFVAVGTVFFFFFVFFSFFTRSDAAKARVDTFSKSTSNGVSISSTAGD